MEKLNSFYGTVYMFRSDQNIYFETKHTKEELDKDFGLLSELVEAEVIKQINVQSYLEEIK
jgi:hypothetical protein